MTDFETKMTNSMGTPGMNPQTTTRTVGDGCGRHSSLLFLASRSALVINRRA